MRTTQAGRTTHAEDKHIFTSLSSAGSRSSETTDTANKKVLHNAVCTRVWCVPYLRVCSVCNLVRMCARVQVCGSYHEYLMELGKVGYHELSHCEAWHLSLALGPGTWAWLLESGT